MIQKKLEVGRGRQRQRRSQRRKTGDGDGNGNGDGDGKEGSGGVWDLLRLYIDIDGGYTDAVCPLACRRFYYAGHD
jgi:hypothetical protein